MNEDQQIETLGGDPQKLASAAINRVKSWAQYRQSMALLEGAGFERVSIPSVDPHGANIVTRFERPDGSKAMLIGYANLYGTATHLQDPNGRYIEYLKLTSPVKLEAALAKLG